MIPEDSKAEIKSESGNAAIDLAPGANVQQGGNTITVAPVEDESASNYVDNFGNVVLTSGGKNDKGDIPANTVIQPDGTAISGTNELPTVKDDGSVTLPSGGATITNPDGDKVDVGNGEKIPSIVIGVKDAETGKVETSKSIKLGDGTLTLEPAVFDSEINFDEYTCTSVTSNPANIVTTELQENGTVLVTPVSTGTATITATYAKDNGAAEGIALLDEGEATADDTLTATFNVTVEKESSGGGGGGGSAGGMVFREEGDGMMEAAIEARELRYIYEDGTAALKGINLRAERGKITGILGANGAGKSTLFLNLNGVLQPSDGEILLDGVPVKRDRKGLTELRRRVGIVFQDPDDQLFSADVYRDISFGAVNLGLPEAEVRRRVEAAMERTGVSHLRDKPTHALSFGQKKRVAIAGVLVMEPEALILDEPTAGLDPQGVSDLLELLTSLRDSQGMTILMATHDMDVVPLCCDYAYLLGGGSVLAQGTPEELFTKAELLRANHLRLPRIAHLMAILRDRDGLDVTPVGTIGAARRELLRLLKQEELL